MLLADGRIEGGACIPSSVVVAVGSAPSPVDMNHAGQGIISVDHECMAGSHILSAIEHGATGLYVVFDETVELGLSRGLRAFLE